MTNQNFLGLDPEFTDPDRSRYAILPVPYEGTVSYARGTAAGPAAIIDASSQVELFDEELLREFHHAGVTTLPAVEVADDPGEMISRIRAAAEPVVRTDKFLMALGGEHSITAPLVKLADEHHGPVSVLQVDAHADLRDSYEGSKHSHASVMRRVLEITDKIAQVGIRAFSKEEFDECPEQVSRFVTPAIIRTDPAWIDRVLELLGENVYVTVDIDGLDPSVAPGTGTPEPGGLQWHEMTALLGRVCAERNVVATDVVETRPLPDTPLTEFTAARLAAKVICYTQS